MIAVMESQEERRALPAEAPLLALPVVLSVSLALAVSDPTSDWELAKRGGEYLLAGNLTVYADMPKVQMGPLALLLSGPLPSKAYLAVVSALIGVVLYVAILPYRDRPRAYVTGSLAGLLLAWPWAAYAVQGHGDDALVVVGLTIMVSAIALARPGWLVAGFVIAIAAKPTAILFLPLVFASSLRRGLLATALGGLVWVPFILADPWGFLSAGKGQGDMWPYSLPDLLGGEPYSGFPHWLRVFQLVGGLALCWFLTWRHRPIAAVVVAVVTFRVLAEPGTWNYYSTAVVAAALLLDLRLGRHVIPWVTVLAFVSFVAPFGDPPLSLAQGVVRLAALGSVLVLSLLVLPSKRDDAPLASVDTAPDAAVSPGIQSRRSKR